MAGVQNAGGAGARKRKPIGRGLATVLALVALAVACVGVHYIPGGPVPYLVVLAVLAVTSGYIVMARYLLVGRLARASGLVMVLLLAIGGALLFLPAVRLTGTVSICAGIALIPVFVVEVAGTGFKDDTAKDRRALPTVRGYDRAIALAVGVLAGLFVLNQVAGVMRVNDGYFKRYGVLVQADTRGTCSSVVRRGDHHERCDATWTVDGATVTGSLVSNHPGAFPFGAQHVPAYVIGDTAVATNLMDDLGPMVVLGRTPYLGWGWLFPVALIGWIGFLVARRRRRSRRSA